MASKRQLKILCKGAPIVLPPCADTVTALAAGELARFLYLLTGVESRIVSAIPRSGAAILLGNEPARAVGAPADARELKDEGFVIQAGQSRDLAFVSIVAGQSRGLLYGIYALLEELGMGFYLGGETFPDKPVQAALPLGFRRQENPCFKVRGSLLHDNALIGTTCWGESDYRAYFSRMVRLRCNTVVLVCYDEHAAEVWHEENGRLLSARPLRSSLTKPDCALAALPTSQFYFGTGDYFDEEVFSHPVLAVTRDPAAQRREITRALSRAITLAKAGGLDVAVGFMAPCGDDNHPADPTDRHVREFFQRRVRAFLARNPDLTYFLLSNHEGGGCSGTRLPADSSTARRLFKAQQPVFAYLGNSRRVWEAIRCGRFAQLAWEVIQKEAPHVKLALNGFGGDRWMRFADYCLGFDKILPPDVIFTCYDNIESTISNTVSTAWGELPPARERWAIPWLESDLSDFWTPQPNVAGLREQADDALRKGCQGLAVMTWRTRDFEEEIGFAARWAWNPALTPEEFYRRLARDAFGPAQAKRMAAHFLALQGLGKRWTGVRGTAEILAMIFTGERPTLPFELGPEAVRFLLPFARDAARKLAEPYSDKQNLANLADELLKTKDAPAIGITDPVSSQLLGVAEFNRVIRILKALTKERDAKRIRRVLTETVEIVFGVRDRLIQRGLTPAQFCAMDTYWFHAHQLARFTGARAKMARLDRIADDIRELRRTFVARNQVGRLERLDYLLANVDFVRHYDRVAMLLAPGGEIEAAIRRGKALLEKKRLAAARSVAATAYRRLIAADMREAVLALTRKLATQCEWGILAGVNIKPVPKYFEFIGELEALMPVAPPRQVFARLCGNDVHVWWDPPANAAVIKGYHLYRRDLTEKSLRRITATPLPAKTPVFIDRPSPGKVYRYAVSALGEHGWESPPSHAVDIATGKAATGPRIVLRQPVDILRRGEPYEVRAIVCGQTPIAEVTLCYRSSGHAAWRRAQMLLRRGCAYQQVIPEDCVRDGILEWRIEARDSGGRFTYWPPSALPALAQAATVVAYE